MNPGTLCRVSKIDIFEYLLTPRIRCKGKIFEFFCYKMCLLYNLTIISFLFWTSIFEMEVCHFWVWKKIEQNLVFWRPVLGLENWNLRNYFVLLNSLFICASSKPRLGFLISTWTEREVQSWQRHTFQSTQTPRGDIWNLTSYPVPR